jgi:EAL domain-containing protein (putative c-di-GMP-specific phosphodiesterase class I)
MSDASRPPSRELEVAGAWITALTEGSHEAVALLGDRGEVHYLSVCGVVSHLLGREAADVMQMGTDELLHPQDERRVVEAFEAVAQHPGARITLTYRAKHRDGHYVTLESTAVNRMHESHIGAVVAHTRRAGSDKGDRGADGKQETHIEDQASFVAAVEDALAGGEAGAFSLLLVELERYKQLLDVLGRRASEQLLRDVGQQLHELLRPSDTLARIEHRFAVLLDGVDDRRTSERIAHRIRKSLGNKFRVGERSVRSDLMVGVVSSSQGYGRPEDDDNRRKSLAAEMRQALREGDFQVHYLPIVSLATRRLIGFEALLRWQHAQRGLLLPQDFLEAAEESGVIVPLGRWVLNEACRQMADWTRRFRPDPPMFVTANLSSHQFVDHDLHELVEVVLDDTALEPHQLTIELNERSLNDHRSAVASTLTRLKAMGVRMSVDNFGAGDASLRDLHDLDFDRLKIDRGLIGAMTESGKTRDLVEALIGLAHGLAMEVVAVGVETPGQAAQLSKMWCEYAQGHLFGKVLDANAAGALIADNPGWWGG